MPSVNWDITPVDSSAMDIDTANLWAKTFNVPVGTPFFYDSHGIVYVEDVEGDYLPVGTTSDLVKKGSAATGSNVTVDTSGIVKQLAIAAAVAFGIYFLAGKS